MDPESGQEEEGGKPEGQDSPSAEQQEGEECGKEEEGPGQLPSRE